MIQMQKSSAKYSKLNPAVYNKNNKSQPHEVYPENSKAGSILKKKSIYLIHHINTLNQKNPLSWLGSISSLGSVPSCVCDQLWTGWAGLLIFGAEGSGVFGTSRITLTGMARMTILFHVVSLQSASFCGDSKNPKQSIQLRPRHGTDLPPLLLYLIGKGSGKFSPDCKGIEMDILFYRRTCKITLQRGIDTERWRIWLIFGNGYTHRDMCKYF